VHDGGGGRDGADERSLPLRYGSAATMSMGPGGEAVTKVVGLFGGAEIHRWLDGRLSAGLHLSCYGNCRGEMQP
jgi:hypothetical protein